MGHVVVGVPAWGVTVDVAAAQFDRPQKGIRVPGPLITSDIPDAFWGTPGTEVAVNVEGAVGHCTRVGPRPYTTSPNWMRRSTNDACKAAFTGISGDAIRPWHTWETDGSWTVYGADRGPI